MYDMALLRNAFLDGSEGELWHVGFVCHHVDVDGCGGRQTQGSMLTGSLQLSISTIGLAPVAGV